MMDKKLQAYYEARFSMMATEGWKDLIEDAQVFFDGINKVSAIQNENDLFMKKGQLDVLQWLLSLKDSSSQTYEQLINDSSGEAQNGS
jgi:hypothetical protein